MATDSTQPVRSFEESLSGAAAQIATQVITEFYGGTYRNMYDPAYEVDIPTTICRVIFIRDFETQIPLGTIDGVLEIRLKSGDPRRIRASDHPCIRNLLEDLYNGGAALRFSSDYCSKRLYQDGHEQDEIEIDLTITKGKFSPEDYQTHYNEWKHARQSNGTNVDPVADIVNGN